MWTSAKKVDENSTAAFSWCSNNSMVAEFHGNHSRWEIGQPDNMNNSQHCVSLKINNSAKYFAMHDSNCSQKLKLVCQVIIFALQMRVKKLIYYIPL
jgi:hypothetical protein